MPTTILCKERRTTPWRSRSWKRRSPLKYHSEIEVFVKQEADKLRPYGPEDHEIRLPEGAIAPFARNYKPMSAQELEAVKKYLDEQLAKGFIRPSSSAAASPILLGRKPGYPSLCRLPGSE